MGLVLTRNEGQSIIIGDDIEVTIVNAHRGKAKLNINAPRSVAVDRSEIRAKKDYDEHFKMAR